VMDAAGDDAVADSIVEHAAREIALAVATAARKLALTGHKLPLAVTGGVILANEGYRTRIVAALKDLEIEAEPVTRVHDRAEGGVKIAWGMLRAGGGLS